MMVVIPAHFLGSVVGIVAYKAILPFMPTVVRMSFSALVAWKLLRWF
jgi:hypothetical protein